MKAVSSTSCGYRSALVLLCVVSLAALARPAAAQGDNRGASLKFLPLHPFNGFVAAHLGVGWLEENARKQLHFGDGGFAFSVAVGVTVFDVVNASAAFGGVGPSDDAPVVEGGSESSVSITSLSGAIGPRTPYLRLGRLAGIPLALALFGNFGYSSIAGRRANTYCLNCTVQDLDVEDGAFLEFGVDFGAPSRGSLGLEFELTLRNYLDDTVIQRELLFGVVIPFL